MEANYYEEYVEAEVVLPDRKGEKLMVNPGFTLNVVTSSQEKVTIMPFRTSLYMNSSIMMERRRKRQLI